MATNPNDIRHIGRQKGIPDKIYRVVNGELTADKDVKKIIRIMNGAPVVVWDIGEPEPPVLAQTITVWNIEAGTFTFPVMQTGADPPAGTIDWGDGTSEDYVSNKSKTHVYASSGIYTITVNANLTQLTTVVNEYTGRVYKGWSFSAQDNLISVVLADTIENLSVSGGDFWYCEALESIRLSKNIKKIPKLTFHYCRSLESLVIPEGVESIDDDYAISRCYSLKSVTLPNTLVSIGRDAFTFDNYLSEITIPSSVQTIAYSAFTGIARSSKVPSAKIYVQKPYNSIAGAPWNADDDAEVIWLG